MFKQLTKQKYPSTGAVTVVHLKPSPSKELFWKLQGWSLAEGDSKAPTRQESTDRTEELRAQDVAASSVRFQRASGWVSFGIQGWTLGSLTASGKLTSAM